MPLLPIKASFDIIQYFYILLYVYILIQQESSDLSWYRNKEEESRVQAFNELEGPDDGPMSADHFELDEEELHDRDAYPDFAYFSKKLKLFWGMRLGELREADLSVLPGVGRTIKTCLCDSKINTVCCSIFSLYNYLIFAFILNCEMNCLFCSQLESLCFTRAQAYEILVKFVSFGANIEEFQSWMKSIVLKDGHVDRFIFICSRALRGWHRVSYFVTVLI